MKPSSVWAISFLYASQSRKGWVGERGSVDTGVDRDDLFTVFLLQCLAGGSYLPCSLFGIWGWNVHRNPPGGKSLQHDAVRNAF